MAWSWCSAWSGSPFCWTKAQRHTFSRLRDGLPRSMRLMDWKAKGRQTLLAPNLDAVNYSPIFVFNQLAKFAQIVPLDTRASWAPGRVNVQTSAGRSAFFFSVWLCLFNGTCEEQGERLTPAICIHIFSPVWHRCSIINSYRCGATRGHDGTASPPPFIPLKVAQQTGPASEGSALSTVIVTQHTGVFSAASVRALTPDKLLLCRSYLSEYISVPLRKERNVDILCFIYLFYFLRRVMSHWCFTRGSEHFVRPQFACLKIHWLSDWILTF